MADQDDTPPVQTIRLDRVSATGGKCDLGDVILGALAGGALGKTKLAVGIGAAVGCILLGDSK